MNKNPHNNQDNEISELLQELVKALAEALYEEFLSEPDDEEIDKIYKEGYLAGSDCSPWGIPGNPYKDDPERADIWDHAFRNALFDNWH